jgi:hypothetical protein
MTTTEKDGGGPPAGEAANHQHQNPHPHEDRVKSDSTSEDGQGATAEADLLLFFGAVYGNATGYLHVVYGKDWYRNGDKLKLKIWSERGRWTSSAVFRCPMAPARRR